MNKPNANFADDDARFRPELVKNQELDSKATEQLGGGGPPVSPLKNDLFDLYFVLVIGLILTTLMSFILTKDPATQTFWVYSNQWTPNWGNFRVIVELSILAVGFGCTVVPMTSLFMIFRARAIERVFGKKVRSLQAKKLENVACESNF